MTARPGPGASVSAQPPARRSPFPRPQPSARRSPFLSLPSPALSLPSLTRRATAMMRPHVSGAIAAALGMLVLAWPLAWAPAWAFAAAGVGAVAVLGAAFTPGERGRAWPAIAVAAAVASCAGSRAGTAALAAEGLFILAYLLAADAPAGLTRPGRWLRLQAFPVIGGLIGTGAVLAALTLHRTDSVWLTVAGLAAAVAAYLIALPGARR
jgi:hypothetical protein